MALPPNTPGEIVVAGDHIVSKYLDGIGDIETKIHVANHVWHRTCIPPPRHRQLIVLLRTGARVYANKIIVRIVPDPGGAGRGFDDHVVRPTIDVTDVVQRRDDIRACIPTRGGDRRGYVAKFVFDQPIRKFRVVDIRDDAVDVEAFTHHLDRRDPFLAAALTAYRFGADVMTNRATGDEARLVVARRQRREPHIPRKLVYGRGRRVHREVLLTTIFGQVEVCVLDRLKAEFGCAQHVPAGE